MAKQLSAAKLQQKSTFIVNNAENIIYIARITKNLYFCGNK